MQFWIAGGILRGFEIDFRDLTTCACTRAARTSRAVRHVVIRRQIWSSSHSQKLKMPSCMSLLRCMG